MKRIGWILLALGLGPLGIELYYMAIGYVYWPDVHEIFSSLFIGELVLAGFGALLINLRKWTGTTEAEMKSQDLVTTESTPEPSHVATGSRAETPQFFIRLGIVLAVVVALSFLSTLLSCPDGPNTGGSDTTGTGPSGVTVTGISCFWAVPLTNFFGTIFGLAAIVTLIVGVVKLKRAKK